MIVQREWALVAKVLPLVAVMTLACSGSTESDSSNSGGSAGEAGKSGAGGTGGSNPGGTGGGSFGGSGASTGEDCNNSIDDDNDGMVDCADSDCAYTSTCTTGGCDNPPECSSHEENCYEGSLHSCAVACSPDCCDYQVVDSEECPGGCYAEEGETAVCCQSGTILHPGTGECVSTASLGSDCSDGANACDGQCGQGLVCVPRATLDSCECWIPCGNTPESLCPAGMACLEEGGVMFCIAQDA